MPPPCQRDYCLINLLLSAYENHSWANCRKEWLDQQVRDTPAVEILATRATDGKTLAIEHTLIQPFPTDKKDFVNFEKAGFLRIEEDQSLIVPERYTQVRIPAGALQKKDGRKAVAARVHQWLQANSSTFPEGLSQQICPTATGPLTLQVNVIPCPRKDSKLTIRRYGDEHLSEVIEKALQKKLPKLVQTAADKRILLLEYAQFYLQVADIYAEIEKRRPLVSDLAKVHEIWYVDTFDYEREKVVYFLPYDGVSSIPAFIFQDGQLIGYHPRI